MSDDERPEIDPPTSWRTFHTVQWTQEDVDLYLDGKGHTLVVAIPDDVTGQVEQIRIEHDGTLLMWWDLTSYLHAGDTITYGNFLKVSYT